MKQQDIWRLTIGYWPRAAEAGLLSCRAVSYRQDGPEFYWPHDLDFAHRPGRDDFLAVVRQTPWMQAWSKTLLPIIACHEWPVVGPCHKAAHVELKADGKVVGELRVYRQTLYLNEMQHAAA
jgi:hypothetical protein